MTPNAIPNLRLEQTLKAEENAAIKAHEFARDEFSRRICSTQIDGWPNEVQEAQIKLDITRQALVIALIRLTDFMRQGVVPGDLRKNINVQAERTKGVFEMKHQSPMDVTNLLKQLRIEIDAAKERIAALEGVKASGSQDSNERRSNWMADASPAAQVKESSKTLRAASG